MNSIRSVCAGALFLALVATPSAFAGIVYVDASATTGANDGSSWANAFQGSSGLQSALAVAVAGDQIWVADGTYLPTSGGSRFVSFGLVSAVQLYGGFAGGETNLSERDPSANIAVLSGDLAGNDGMTDYAENSYHVVGGNNVSGAVLDGFTIRGGNADGPSATNNDDGAGLYLKGHCPVLNCVFEDNRCTGIGAAALVLDVNDFPVFYDCKFDGNEAGTGAGAVHVGPTGDAAYFYRCIFTNNTAPRASAIDGYLAFDVFFRDCLFAENVVTGSEGGTVNMSFESYPWFIGCTMAANTSTVSQAAGVYCFRDTFIYNSIFYFNTGPGGSQTSANQVYSIGAPIAAASSCVQGGLAGTNMIFANPEFIDVTEGNFRLAPFSPCVDAANNSSTNSSLDLDRTPRKEDVASTPDTGFGTPPIVDMGAYETPGGPYAPVCPGDGTLATQCPCANSGSFGRGCRNSIPTAQGALLTGSGGISPDTIVLTASSVRPGLLCILLQGNFLNGAGFVFGDGVRCVAGSLKRINSHFASADASFTYPRPGDPSISSRSATLGDSITPGTDRWYQVWYRDGAPTFCPPPQGGTSNVTSGLVVHW